MKVVEGFRWAADCIKDRVVEPVDGSRGYPARVLRVELFASGSVSYLGFYKYRESSADKVRSRRVFFLKAGPFNAPISLWDVRSLPVFRNAEGQLLGHF